MQEKNMGHICPIGRSGVLINENRRLSNHGGLIIYVHDTFSFKVLNKDMHITHTSKLFESVIVET